jgi:hypothetical protein
MFQLVRVLSGMPPMVLCSPIALLKVFLSFPYSCLPGRIAKHQRQLKLCLGDAFGLHSSSSTHDVRDCLR